MPYLEPERKRRMDKGNKPRTAGDLTYLITMAMISGANAMDMYQKIDEVVTRYQAQRARSFALCAEVIGALDAASREYKRRVDPYDSATRVVSNYQNNYYMGTVAPYEDQKILINGDVYRNG